MKKPLALVTVGLPYSGKTTWADAHPERLPIASLSYFIQDVADSKNISYAKALKKYENEAQRQLAQRIDDFTRQKRPFIWDAPHLTKEERDEIYDLLHPTHDVHFVCFLVPLNICFERIEREKENGRKPLIDKKALRDLARNTTFPKKGDNCEKIVLLVHPQWPKAKAEAA